MVNQEHFSVFFALCLACRHFSFSTLFLSYFWPHFICALFFSTCLCFPFLDIFLRSCASSHLPAMTFLFYLSRERWQWSASRQVHKIIPVCNKTAFLLLFVFRLEDWPVLGLQSFCADMLAASRPIGQRQVSWV